MPDTQQEWHCPYCGKLMTEADNGMECQTHGVWSWAALGVADSED